MAIGVFDSGVGGLSIHRALVERFPTADFVYLADQAQTPYGRLPGERIVDLTRQGCQRLFDAGADLVVLGCNTASAIALRRLQQTWLPQLRQERGRPTNILGIIVPTIERQGRRVRLLTLLVFVGGLGRLVSLGRFGAPDLAMQLAFIMELLVTPAICLWQWRLERRMDANLAAV